MFETYGFLTCLLLTVVLLVMTLVAGLRRQRRRHITRAIATVVLLGVTVVFAFMMAKVRSFPDREMAIHRVFSMSVACLVPLVGVTGVVLARRPAVRWPHRICVGLFLLMALGATGTGVWMLTLSSPK